MKLHHLRDFLAIIENGSISAAAKQLGIAQPSLSRSIRELEADVGAPLIERHARGIELTPMGQSFARRASSAVTELRRGRDEIEQMLGRTVGSVTAGVSGMSHIALLSEALRPFRQRYPKVQLNIEEGTYPVIESRMRDGTIDLYVGPEPEAGCPPEFRSETLLMSTRVVMARRGHPLAHARSLAELLNADWMTTSIADRGETEFRALFELHGLPVPRLSMRVMSSLSILVSLLHGDVLAITTKNWAQWQPMRDRLVVIDVKEHIAAPAVVLMHRAAVPPTPAAEYLCDMLRRAAVHYSRSGDMPD
jgi:DNA-binding transcriptional LysR family regulator